MATNAPRLLAVTGNPVLADPTPQMINAALAYAEIPGRCLRLAADSAQEAVHTMAMLDIQAMRVAAPLDRSILPLLTTAAPSAIATGAANIVLNTGEGGLVGHYVEGPKRSASEDPFPGTSPLPGQVAAVFPHLAEGASCPATVMAEAMEMSHKGFQGRIALMGFMGCGKSRNGRRLAHRMGWRFRDMDAVIEETTGRKIPEIFASDGEDGFRRIETEVLESLANDVETVVSCGGGVVVRPENRKILARQFLCVWLVASIDTIIARTSGSDRPLLACTDPRTRAESLFAQRKMLYAECNDLVVSTEAVCLREADAKIHEEVRAAFG